jgi:DoxX-like family
MFTAYITLTLVAAAMVAFSAYALLTHKKFVMEPVERLRIPRSWWPWLATAKAAGAAGLVVGLFVPRIGALAGICLVLYFVGAVIICLMRRWYAHIPVPLLYVAPVTAALAIGFAADWPLW